MSNIFNIFKNIKRERILFMTGAVLLALAVLVLTILPYLINNFTADTYVSTKGVKVSSYIFYFLTFLCFLFSPRYTTLQIKWLSITLIYYIAFQILIKLIS